MTCSTNFFPNGINRNCISALREVKAVLIHKAGTSKFDNAAALDNLENMRVKLQEEEDLYVFKVQGSTATKGEPNLVTSGYNIEFPAGYNPPQLTVFGETNACDFREVLKSFSNGTWECRLLLADNTIMDYSDGKDLYGFTTKLGVPRFVPDRDNQAEQFELRLYFIDEEQFTNYSITKVNYGVTQLNMAMPSGLNMIEATAYAAGANVVDVNIRCTDNEIADVLTGEVVSTNIVGETVTVTPTYNAVNLNYDVVFAKGAGSPVAGDYIYYRLVDKNGLIYNRVTNVLQIQA
jgi:hypothetical protein